MYYRIYVFNIYEIIYIRYINFQKSFGKMSPLL